MKEFRYDFQFEKSKDHKSAIIIYAIDKIDKSQAFQCAFIYDDDTSVEKIVDMMNCALNNVINKIANEGKVETINLPIKRKSSNHYDLYEIEQKANLELHN